MTLADRLVATRNRPSGFDWMRLMLAIGIISWHTIALSYGADIEHTYLTSPLWRPPVVALLGMFFSLSGFLVAGSLERCRTVVSFAGLRIFRIFPALVVEVMLSALILGPLLTHDSINVYFRHWDFRFYFLNVFGLIHYVLPGVFPNNPIPHTVNGQLWTVPFELKCYEILLVVAFLGFYRRKIVLISVLIAAVSYVISQACLGNCSDIESTPGLDLILSGDELVFCFLLGNALFRFREQVVWSLWLGVLSALVAFALVLFPGGKSLAPIPLAYLTVYLGLLNPHKNRLLFSGDYSYGLYLYGFPLQQVIASAGPWAHHWYVNLVLSLPLAAAIAAFSWKFVEKPVLSRKALLNRPENWYLACAGLARVHARRAVRLVVQRD